MFPEILYYLLTYLEYTFAGFADMLHDEERVISWLSIQYNFNLSTIYHLFILI